MKEEGLKDYIQTLEYENKRMGDFLKKLGYSNEAISDIIINSCDTITKVKVYALIHSTISELKKLTYKIDKGALLWYRWFL